MITVSCAHCNLRVASPPASRCARWSGREEQWPACERRRGWTLTSRHDAFVCVSPVCGGSPHVYSPPPPLPRCMSRELARLGTSALEQAQIAQEIRAGGASVPIRQASVSKALPLASPPLVADRRRQQAEAQQRLEQENRKCEG